MENNDSHEQSLLKKIYLRFPGYNVESVGQAVTEYRKNEISEERPPVFRSTIHEIVVIVLLTFAPALSSSSSGAMQIAIPKIGQSFEISGGRLTWTISAFSISSGSFVLLFASISDAIGRKRMVLAAYVWFAVWSLISGFMQNDIVFNICRALQGLSGACSPPAAVGILGATYVAGKRKNRALATFAAGAPLGFIIGIVVGGICSEFIGWRAIPFFSSIEYLCFAVLVWVLVPRDAPLDLKRTRSILSKIDYFGAFLATSGLLLFVFALTQSGSLEDGWRTPYVIALLIAGVLLFTSFLFWESKAKKPLMPLHIWKFPYFALCMMIAATGYMSFTGVLNYYLPLYFQNIRNASAILTTAYMAPQAICGVLVNVIAALTLHIIPGQILMIIAMVSFTASAILWALQPIFLIYWAMAFPAICLSVVGADLVYNVSNMHTLNTVPPASQSTAAGIFNTIIQLSTAVGLAASASISEAAMRKSDKTGVYLQHDSFKAAFWFATGVSSTGLIGSFFLKIGTQGHKHTNATDEKDDTPDSVLADPQGS
ncbi:major facilitator superfamily-domain-containing protein [Lipomyces japonicus]|uniref:major facilitator superfamily-domain-containing protein n=1 Tax=Lipomyces japonicus TaxID=56871 RepID=UPI0034CF5293